MPQGLTVPAWYNDDHYISEKVDECNTIKFENQADWTADKVRAAIATAYDTDVYSPDLGYSNFVDSGNAENCSPKSPLQCHGIRLCQGKSAEYIAEWPRAIRGISGLASRF